MTSAGVKVFAEACLSRRAPQESVVDPLPAFPRLWQSVLGERKGLGNDAEASSENLRRALQRS
jgi:hypothetical protein